MVSGRVLRTAQILVGGDASGPYLRLQAPLSLWGGLDPTTAVITDRNHPQHGTCLAGRALHLPASRGSSSSSSVLLECVRLGTSPALILLEAPDLILTIGAAAAWEIYGRGPTVALMPHTTEAADGGIVRIVVGDTPPYKASGPDMSVLTL